MVWIPKSLIFDLSPPQGVTAFSLSHAAALGAGFFVAPQVHGAPPLLFYHSGSGWPISHWREAHHSGASCPFFHLSGAKHPLFSLHHSVTFTFAARSTPFLRFTTVSREVPLFSFYRSCEALSLLFNQIDGAAIFFSPHHRGAHSFVTPQRRGAPTVLFHPSGAGHPLFCFTPAARGVHCFVSPQRRAAPTVLFRRSGAGRLLIRFTKVVRGARSFVSPQRPRASSL